MLKKEPKKLSWKAVRRGDLYCAPACGRGCTSLEHMTAMNIARAMVERLGQGWKPEISENLGWHAWVRSPCGRIRLLADKWRGELTGYSAFLNHASDHPGGKWVGNGATPEAAVKEAIKQGLRYQKDVNAILEGLEDWKPSGTIKK